MADLRVLFVLGWSLATVVLLNTAPVSAQEKYSYGCFGSAGACLDHNLVCPNTSRVAIEQAFYGHKEWVNCTTGVINCQDACCRYDLEKDCFNVFVAKDITDIYRNCSENSCLFRTPRLIKTCLKQGGAHQFISSYSVVQYLCVPDVQIIPMCGVKMQKIGNTISVIYDPRSQYRSNGQVCLCSVHNLGRAQYTIEGIDLRLNSGVNCGRVLVQNGSGIMLEQSCTSPNLWPNLRIGSTNSFFTFVILTGSVEFAWIRFASYTTSLTVACNLEGEQVTTTTTTKQTTTEQTTTQTTTTTTTTTYPQNTWTPSTTKRPEPTTSAVQETTTARQTTTTQPEKTSEQPSSTVTYATNDMTPAASTDMTPAASTDMTPAASTNMTPAASTDMTPAANTDMIPAASTDMTPAASTNKTPAAGTDMTPAASTDMTPAASTDMTPAASTDMTPAASTNMTPSGNTDMTRGTGKESTAAPTDKTPTESSALIDDLTLYGGLGGAIAAIALLLIVGIAVVCCCRRGSSSTEGKEVQPEHTSAIANPAYASLVHDNAQTANGAALTKTGSDTDGYTTLTPQYDNMKGENNNIVNTEPPLLKPTMSFKDDIAEPVNVQISENVENGVENKAYEYTDIEDPISTTQDVTVDIEDLPPPVDELGEDAIPEDVFVDAETDNQLQNEAHPVLEDVSEALDAPASQFGDIVSTEDIDVLANDATDDVSFPPAPSGVLSFGMIRL